MVSYAQRGEKKYRISGDVFLAMLIASSVIIGDFILTHLPF